MTDPRFYWHGDVHGPWFDFTHSDVDVAGYGLVRVWRVSIGPLSLLWSDA